MPVVEQFVTEFITRDRNTVSTTRLIAQNAKAAAAEMRNLRLQTGQARLAQQESRLNQQRIREAQQMLRLQQQMERAARSAARASAGSGGRSGGRPSPLLSVSGGAFGGTGGIGGFLQFGGRLGPIMAIVAAGLQAAAQAAGALAEMVGRVVVGMGQIAVQGTVALFNLGAKFDGLERGLSAVSGGAKNARDRMKELRDVAKLPGLNLEQTISGDTRLQAAGLAPALSKRLLMGFGNAVATVGGGPEEIQGVVLAIGQIAAKGKVFAEEINQINERVPQIRKAMKDAFGTSDTEVLGKMGISSEEFLTKVVAQLEKLPRVTGGAANALENIKDSFTIAIMPAARGVARVFESVAPVIERIITRAEPFLNNVGKVLDAIANSGAAAQVLENAFNAMSRIAGVKIDTSVEGLTNAASYLLATFEAIPSMIDQIGIAVKDAFAPILTAYDATKAMFGYARMAADPLGTLIGKSGGGGIGSFVNNPLTNPLGYLLNRTMGTSVPEFVLNPLGVAARNTVGGLGANLSAGKDTVLNQIQHRAASLRALIGGAPSAADPTNPNAPGNTPSPTSPIGRIVEATERTARATEKQLELNSQVIGGGSISSSGIPIIDILGGRSSGNRTVRIQVDAPQEFRRFVQDIAEQVMGGLVVRPAFGSYN